MNRRSQTLYRDTSDRMITGVCSGLGHYFDVDTTLVRVAFVVLTVLGGGGVLAYLLLSVILEPRALGPEPSPVAPPPPAPAAERPVTPPIERTDVVADESEEDTVEETTSLEEGVPEPIAESSEPDR